MLAIIAIAFRLWIQSVPSSAFNHPQGSVIQPSLHAGPRAEAIWGAQSISEEGSALLER